LGIETITLLIVTALLLLMMTGMPLGIVTLTVSIGTALLYFGPRGLFLVASNVYGLLENYPLVAVPLFVFMASILERAGVAEDLFNAMSIVSGDLRGGVAVQTTAVAVVMAAMTGIMGGEIVMLGLIALPQMLRLGYDRKLAMGTICAGGSLATLIPPSIIMIVYGLTAQVGIGTLFLAGALPGLLLASLYVAYIMVRCRLQPELAPLAPEAMRRLPRTEKLRAMQGLILPLAVIVCSARRSPRWCAAA
jgi:tripartite ATP-independent transporter DctM subunit